MPVHLLISPPATGKTQTCLDLVKSTAQDSPFAQIWYLVPDQLQADAVRARFSASGQVLPVRVATFQDLYEEILERVGRSLPTARQSMLHRLLQEIIRILNAHSQIPHYAPICVLPGFLNGVRERISELKRALVAPDRLAEVAYAQSDPGLIDLAQIYDEFQQRLLNLGWTDLEGLSAYALEALGSGQNVLTDVALWSWMDSITSILLRCRSYRLPPSAPPKPGSPCRAHRR